MNYELDGICIHCQGATPVSENTMLPEGIVCSFCRETTPTAAELRDEQLQRLAELETERQRLMSALAGDRRPDEVPPIPAMAGRYKPMLN